MRRLVQLSDRWFYGILIALGVGWIMVLVLLSLRVGADL